MNYLINEVVDKYNKIDKLYLSLSKSLLKDNYIDLEFYSVYSEANNSSAEQTKWKTTIPRQAFFAIMSSLTNFAENQLFQKGEFGGN